MIQLLWLLLPSGNLSLSQGVTTCHWASSTGLTTVSKFKPRLPAQWAVSTHRKRPSRLEKVTSWMNWPIRNTVSNSKLNLAYRQNHNVKPFILFYRTLKNFVSFNDHIITVFSWVVTMALAVLSADILRWTVTSHWHRQDDCKCGVFVISEHTK